MNNKVGSRREITQSWLQEVVIGLNLCPFANPFFQRGQIEIDELTGDAETCLISMVAKFQEMQLDASTETVLYLLPPAFDDFDEYLDFVALAEALMADLGFEGEFQLASFHPDYCFDGLEPDDAANYTNRSPYPMLHILREATVEKVLSNYENPDDIPERNIALTRSMGVETMSQMLKDCQNP